MKSRKELTNFYKNIQGGREMRISGIMNRMTKALIRKCLETEEPMKRVLIEPGRTYGFLDFIRIPVLVCPFFTLIKIINQAAAAITPSCRYW